MRTIRCLSVLAVAVTLGACSQDPLQPDVRKQAASEGVRHESGVVMGSGLSFVPPQAASDSIASRAGGYMGSGL